MKRKAIAVLKAALLLNYSIRFSRKRIIFPINDLSVCSSFHFLYHFYTFQNKGEHSTFRTILNLLEIFMEAFLVSSMSALFYAP